MAVHANPFRQGNYVPVASELTQFDLAVDGRLPLALSGTYVRTGPNAIAIPDPSTHHWFNGTGMLHGVAIRDGKAQWYKARWIEPPDVDADVPPASIATAASGNGNGSVFLHGGRIYVVNDQALPCEINTSLETLGARDFQGRLKIGMNSHPKVDPVDGSLHTLGYDVEHAQLRYNAFDRQGHALASATIDVQRPIMVHEFLVTATHLVYLDLPVVLDMEAAFADEPLPYRWHGGHQARIGIARRDAPARVDWYPIAPCFVLHGFNAYDDGEDVVIDVVRHERMFDRCRNGPGEGAPSVVRWRVLARAGRVLEDTLDPSAQEFPAINATRIGREHRYGYSIGCSPLSGTLNHFASSRIVKHDFSHGTQCSVSLGDDCLVSELTFVPSPGARAEDDGWLVGFAHVPGEARSELLVLPAQDLRAGPVARVLLPRRVPFGFHGTWIPGDHGLPHARRRAGAAT